MESVVQEPVKIVSGNKTLALFDFDGTITTRDTLAEFMIFYRGAWQYKVGLAMQSPFIAAYLLKLMPNWRAKERFLSWFLKGENAAFFERRCQEFAAVRIPELVRPKALSAIKAYKSSGATIAVVTASAENWVKPWCDKMGLTCIGTRLEVQKNTITGRIKGNNCHGEEKVCRIKEVFNLQSFDKIVAYGDSSGDAQMLALASEKFFKPFRG